MKKWLKVAFLFLIANAFLFPNPAFSAMSNDAIVQELRAMKTRIERLEQELVKKNREIEALKAKTEEAEVAAAPEGEGEKWTDRITISGAVEVEYGYESVGFNGAPDEDGDDVALATVEVGIDAQINKYVEANVLLLYEEDDTEEFTVDEGTITIGGIEETYCLYFKGGKYYPHFGELNSYFVSDPLTLEIFEIQESALEIGYDGEWFTIGGGVFNGDIAEVGDDESDVDCFFIDANIHNPEDTLGGISMLMGVSYLSSVGDSDTLQGEANLDITGDFVPDDVVDDFVDGIAAYLVLEYEMFSFGAEYITALDEFRAGEMAYAVDINKIARETEPSALNIELAFRPMDVLQLAVKYEWTDEMYGLFPEDQYGFVVSWDIFECTTLSAEYLHGEFDDNNVDGVDDRDAFTMQLAVEF